MFTDQLHQALVDLRAARYQQVIDGLSPLLIIQDECSSEAKILHQVACYLSDPFQKQFKNQQQYQQKILYRGSTHRHAQWILKAGQFILDKQYKQTIQACYTALSIRPNSSLAYVWLSVLYAQVGQASLLFDRISFLKKEGWQGKLLDIYFYNSVKQVPTQFTHPDLVWSLHCYLVDPCTNPDRVAKIASIQLQQIWETSPYTLDLLCTQHPDYGLDQLHWDFLNSCLTYLTLPLSQLENQLIHLRKEVFEKGLQQNQQWPDSFFHLIVAYGHQSDRNEYVWWIHESEQQQLNVLETLFQEKDFFSIETQHTQYTQRVIQEISLLIALYAMYLPLTSFFKALPQSQLTLFRKRELWPNWIHPLFQRLIYDREQEVFLSSQLDTLTSVTDKTSLKVKQQYEENPYPRWIKLDRLPSYTHLSYSRNLLENIPYSLSIDFPYHDQLSVLIAGGGTGSHPLSIIASNQVQQMTVIDLSMASLGYAQRKALEYQFPTPLQFIQGDLLDLHLLNQRYPLIESVGVLHHMRQPTQGLKALRQILKPKGLMILGLYSERARQRVVEFREYAQKHSLQVTPSVLRKIRHQILHETHGNFPESFKELKSFGDVWQSASMLRDLLFHVQEHRYTPLDIQELCNTHRLKFLGFLHLTAQTKSNYQHLFPDDPHMVSLNHWNDYEQDYPFTFKKMLCFVCQAID